MLVYLARGGVRVFMHKATMYILTQVVVFGGCFFFCVNMCFVSLGKISRSGIAGSEGRCICI